MSKPPLAPNPISAPEEVFGTLPDAMSGMIVHILRYPQSVTPPAWEALAPWDEVVFLTEGERRLRPIVLSLKRPRD